MEAVKSGTRIRINSSNRFLGKNSLKIETVPKPTFDSVLDKLVLSQQRPAEPLVGVFAQETLQKVLEDVAHVLGPFDLSFDNHVHQLVEIVGVEGRVTSEHFVKNAPESPEVGVVVIRPVFDQLWTHVQRCAFDGREHHGLCAHGTRETKVAQFDLVVLAEQNILRFHVSMHDAM